MVRVADARELREAVRLRYEVLALEGGDQRYANHQRCELIDERDGPGISRVVVVTSETNDVVGTLRIGGRNPTPFIADEVYPFDEIAHHLQVTEESLSRSICLFDRSAVHRDFRGRGIFSRMVSFAHEISRTDGAIACLSVVALDNNQPRGALARLGYRDIGLIRSGRGLRASILFCDLRQPR